MSSDTRNHSFSLQPKASEIVNAILDQKKSAFVSDAIVFYDSQKKLTKFSGPGEISDNEADCMPPSVILEMLGQTIDLKPYVELNQMARMGQR